MTNGDLMKKQREFTKTSFGIRAKTFAIFPMFVAIAFFVAALLTKDLEDSLVSTLYVMGFGFSLIGTCIAQLLYARLLKDFITDEKKKK